MAEQLQITLDDDAAQRLRLLAAAPQQQSELLSTLIRAVAADSPPTTDSPPAPAALTLAALAQRLVQLEAEVAELKECWEELEDEGWARAHEEAVREAAAAGEKPIPYEQALAEIGYKRL